MKKLTATVYVRIPLSSFLSGGCVVNCSPNELNINHSEDCGYAITISLPDGAKIAETQYGDTLLIYDDNTTDILRYHSGNNVVGIGTPTDRCCVPVRGIQIISKIEL